MASEELSENDFRYERKFIASNFTSKELEILIKNNPYCFSEVFYKRKINSIYLDSHLMKNYYDNIAGNPRRLKIRVRWYGEIFGNILKPVLELKMKSAELGRKLSFPLDGFSLNGKFDAKALREVFSRSNLPDWVREELKHYVPVILVSYDRKYFRSMDKKFRITLDMNLSFFGIKGRNMQMRECVNRKYRNIIELKYAFKEDYHAFEVANHFPFRLVASSKYVYGLELLDL